MQIYIFSNHSSTNYVRLQELTMQMNLLELILKLQQKESQAGLLWDRCANRDSIFLFLSYTEDQKKDVIKDLVTSWKN